MLIFVILIGLAVGSFIANYSYRYPRGISIVYGRSVCDNCGYKLSWFDNIPLLSFLLIGGKCRKCKQKISIRYPVIEFVTAVLFALTYVSRDLITLNVHFLSLPVALFLLSTSLAIAIVDYEYQIIPENITWASLFVAVVSFLLLGGTDFYVRLLGAFLGALFLLVLNLVTKGKGMGLGDVKLVLYPGFLLVFPLNIIWFFVSFLLGAVVGLLLLTLKQAKIKQRIAFGPFLILGFFITAVFGNVLKSILFPFL